MVLSIWVVCHCDCAADVTGSGSLLSGGSIVLLIASLKKVKTQNLKYGFYRVISLLHYRKVKKLSVEPYKIDVRDHLYSLIQIVGFDI